MNGRLPQMLDSEPMPDVTKFLAGQWVVGAGLTMLFAAIKLLTDAWGLGTLVRKPRFLQRQYSGQPYSHSTLT